MIYKYTCEMWSYFTSIKQSNYYKSYNIKTKQPLKNQSILPQSLRRYMSLTNPVSTTIDNKAEMNAFKKVDYRKKQCVYYNAMFDLYSTHYKEKHSYGIACVRIINNEKQILLVKKRFTYAFNSFTHGSYHPKHVDKLFCKMTLEEKIVILSYRFEYIWYHTWLNHPPDDLDYQNAYNKFYTTFPTLQSLRHAISNTTHVDTIWEIPKGKKEHTESDVSCAKREFNEETKIPSTLYTFYKEFMQYSHIDGRIKYVCKYYFAKLHQDADPPIDIDILQSGELCDARWFNITGVNYIDSSKKLSNIVNRAFTFIDNLDNTKT